MQPGLKPSRWRRHFHLLALSAAGMLLVAGAAVRAGAGSKALPGATVDDLLMLVRNYNPELAAAALDREAAVARIYPAGALDEPMVNLSRDQGFRQTLLTISQDFPLWGKRRLREEVAEADAAAAKGREGGVKSELEEQVKMAFAQYYEAAQAVRITRDIRGLLQGVASSARARYAQGVGNQSDAIRAELERARLDPELAGLTRDEQIAKAKINALIGRPADAPLAQPKGLRRLPPASSLNFKVLMMRARAANPTLATARAEIAAAEGEEKLVERSWYPDVTITAGMSDVAGVGPRPMAGVGVKVPFQWGVREAKAREATAKKGAAQLRLDAAILKIGNELQTALADLSQAQRTEELLQNALGPQSRTAYSSALASYQQGRGDFTPVLEAARQRLQFQIELLKAQIEAQAAVATIERVAGGNL
ncbi:MAG TPA: TolC family protein [Stellaceae bacterium]|nr:TolC family protein [Stellaceae bacterium]